MPYHYMIILSEISMSSAVSKCAIVIYLLQIHASRMQLFKFATNFPTCAILNKVSDSA